MKRGACMLEGRRSGATRTSSLFRPLDDNFGGLAGTFHTVGQVSFCGPAASTVGWVLLCRPAAFEKRRLCHGRWALALAKDLPQVHAHHDIRGSTHQEARRQCDPSGGVEICLPLLHGLVLASTHAITRLSDINVVTTVFVRHG